MIETIQRKIAENLGVECVQVQVVDDSHQHAGHAAMRGNTAPLTHITVIIPASRFEGISRVQRERMVLNALKEEMEAGLHAVVVQVV